MDLRHLSGGPIAPSEPASSWLGPHVLDLMERAGYGLFFVNEEGVLLFCNISARKALGCQNRLVVGSHIRDLDLESALGIDLKPILKQQQVAQRTSIALADRTECEVVIGPVRFGPLPERGLLIMLRPLRAHHEALASVGERIAALCHNLNNQLGALRAWAMIAAQSDNQHASMQAGEELLVALQGLDQLIQEVLTPVRHQPRNPLDLVSLVEQAWATACANLQESHHQLRLESYGEPLWVQGSSEKIGSVLQNLLKNAMEASPTGWVYCSLEQEGEQVVVHIADDGSGVHEDMFLQGGSSKASGHGLGLADVQRSLLHLGGSLDISYPDEGRLSIVVRLPAA
jgi:signal transduction histidine kinase